MAILKSFYILSIPAWLYIFVTFLSRMFFYFNIKSVLSLVSTAFSLSAPYFLNILRSNTRY